MRSLWKDDDTTGLDDLALLVHRSRLVGRETALVLRGGGNTSLKRDETDFRGRTVRVLRIKGSGSDLASCTAADFPWLPLDDLEPLRARRSMDDQEMVDWLMRCLVEPGSRRPSIETLLHAFLPHAHVDHTHADAVLALTDTVDPRRHVEAAFGAEAAFVPYRRPGHRLAQEVAQAVAAAPRARAAVLEKHGLITWGADARACYEATLAAVSRAEAFVAGRSRGAAVFGALVRPPRPPAERRAAAARIAPRLRGLVAGRDGGAGRVVLRFDDAADVLDFAGREAAAQVALAGPATPDHLMYTRARPLVVTPPEGGLDTEAAVERLGATLAKDVSKYAAWYEIFVRKQGGSGGAPIDPRPRVILIPGLGMFTAWKDSYHARLVADVYHHAIAVMQGAQAIGEYCSLDLKDSHDVEYWPLEVYRMSL